MYVIAGATGNTGSAIADRLLTKGQPVRVIGRDAGRLKRFAERGAEPYVADMTDADAVEGAFSGAKAVYALIPPNITSPDVRGYAEQVAEAIAWAIEEAGVTHAVVLSSIGADKPARTGPVAGLHNLEEKLNRIATLNAVYLRAGYFMENTFPQMDAIRRFGMVAGPFRPDLLLPMIATRDIAAVAADELLNLGFQGRTTRELLGPGDVSYTDVAKAIGRAIGKPELAYVQMPATQFKAAVTQMGMSESMAGLILEMSEALNSGYMVALEKRSPRNTTLTTLETFVAEKFVPAFRAKAASA
jgi:uncharacterized protein YbjT (DUF2867 family)